jgi:hypothetical protein
MNVISQRLAPRLTTSYVIGLSDENTGFALQSQGRASAAKASAPDQNIVTVMIVIIAVRDFLLRTNLLSFMLCSIMAKNLAACDSQRPLSLCVSKSEGDAEEGSPRRLLRAWPARAYPMELATC